MEVFKYLGWRVSMDDNDVRAVRSNMKKAPKCWKMLSRLLRSENMEPRACGMFYKAVVQAVLLFGSESTSAVNDASAVGLPHSLYI